MKNFYVNKDELKDEKFLAVKLHTLESAINQVRDKGFELDYIESDKDYYGVLEQISDDEVEFMRITRINEIDSKYIKFDAIQY